MELNHSSTDLQDSVSEPLTCVERPSRKAAIKMVPVKSSNVAEVGWDRATRTLLVRFVSGATYSYDGVDGEIFEALLAAKSVGSAFHRLVKCGGFSYRLVEEGK